MVRAFVKNFTKGEKVTQVLTVCEYADAECKNLVDVKKYFINTSKEKKTVYLTEVKNK